MQPVNAKAITQPVTIQPAPTRRPPVPTSYWPIEPSNENMPLIEELAQTLGSVPVQIEYTLPTPETVARLARLAVRYSAQLWIFWSPYHHEFWKDCDPRVRREDYWSGRYGYEPRFAEIGAALKKVKGLGRVPVIMDCEKFKNPATRAQELGIGYSDYLAATRSLLEEALRRTVSGFNCGAISQGDSRYYGMGWRQWFGVEAPGALGEAFVDIIDSQRQHSSVIIDRPHQLDGWLSSYGASMLGRTECTAWPWLYLSKQWIPAGDANDPQAKKQVDMPGDYGKQHARIMGEMLYRRLQRVRRVVFYPAPTADVREGWLDHLVEFLEGGYAAN